MDLEYIKREIALSELTEKDLDTKVKAICDFFKDSLHKYEKVGDLETWYNTKGDWVLQIQRKRYEYARVCGSIWNILVNVYGFKDETPLIEIISFMLNKTLDKKLDIPITVVNHQNKLRS